MGICAPTQSIFPKEIRREEDWKEVSTKDRSIGGYIDGVRRVGMKGFT
jgi:hypothetical protein